MAELGPQLLMGAVGVTVWGPVPPPSVEAWPTMPVYLRLVEGDFHKADLIFK